MQPLPPSSPPPPPTTTTTTTHLLIPPLSLLPHAAAATITHRYEIYYKQQVGTEDMFLGTDKTPSSYDCTHLVVKIHFPNCRMQDLDLDVKKRKIKAESADL